MSSKIVPDPNTLKRLQNLSIVGNFLFEISNENAEMTNFFLAKTSLQNFKEEIEMLDLPYEVKIGIDNLIKYLDQKIEKRKKQQIFS